MDFDLVLAEIGEFGRYQKTNYLLVCLPVIFAAANSLSYVFTAGVPNYRCLVPECEANHQPPIFDQPWVLHAVPGTHRGSNTFVPEQCLRFQHDNSSTSIANRTSLSDECPSERFTDRPIECDRWVFEHGERTIVNDWLITCPDNQWKLALVGTLHFAGIVVGSGAFGVLADRYGRKLVFIFCIMFMSVTGIGQAVSSSYVWFSIFGFLNAVGTSGVYPLAFILGVEMVGPSKRELTGIVLNYFYSVGEAAVGLLAWLLGDWVQLQLIVSAPPLLFALYYWFVPESVRWLLAKQNTYRAGKIIRRAAIVNGVVLSDNILQVFEMQAPPSVSTDEQPTTTATVDPPVSSAEKPMASQVSLTEKPSPSTPVIKVIIKEQHVIDDDDDIEADTDEKYAIWPTFRTLFASRVLVLRCFILFYIWAANAFVFYGLSLNSTNLSGNKYVNFILVCLVEIPGLSLAWLAMNKIGRRWSLASSFLVCSFTCMLSGFITLEYTWLMILLFLMGKMGITASFAIVFVHTAEMLPTTIRSGGVGAMSTVARLGALLAPFVPLLSRYYEPLPMTLFGIVSLFGGLLALCLPETLGLKLPDTVEEAEQVGRSQKQSSCRL